MSLEASGSARITAVTVENFKAVRSECQIEFRPITLLFGPNSAGKSTILQALQFMRELLERRNADPDRTIAGGESVDLGGFRNLAQHHDVSQPVTVRIEFSPGNDPLPTYGQLTVNETEDSDLRKDLAENGIGGVETAWIKITCRWHEDDEARRPWITHYEVGLNGRRIAEISTQPPHTPCITFLDFDHPLFVRFDEAEGVTSEQDQGTRQSLKSLAQGLHLDTDSIAPVGGIQLSLGKGDTAIPDFSRPVPIADHIVDDEERPTFDVFAFLTNQILVGTGALLLRQLQRIRYLGPIRQVPPRNFVPQTSPEEARWASGLAAWDALYSRYDHRAHAGDDFFKSVIAKKQHEAVIAETASWII